MQLDISSRDDMDEIDEVFGAANMKRKRSDKGEEDLYSLQ